jgi:chromosome segregation ATPase
MSKHDSLNLAEYVFIAASVAGTIGSALSKEIIFAAIPLTITLGLNAIDRHRFQKLNQQQIEHLQNLIQQTQESQNQTNASLNNSIESLFLRQKEDRELTNRVHLQTQEQIEELKKASVDSNRSINSLAQNFSQLDRLSQSINSENERIDLLENREIDFELKLQELNLIKQEIRNYAQVKHLFEQRLDRLEKDSKNIPSPIKDLIQQTQSDRERIWARIKELDRNNISFQHSLDSLFSRQKEVQ